METQLLQRDDPCSDCQIRKDAEQEMKQTKDIAQPRLADWRCACANCQNIYKFDLLMQYWKAQAKLPPGKGKRCTIPESIQKRMLEYRYEGKKYREIAEIIGVSISQVQRIVKKLKKSKTQETQE